MTPILGETANGIKTTQHSQDLVPDAVIYDVDLTVSLPPHVSAASGLNAIAHAVEALYAPDANPLTSLMAEDGIAALARALPRIVAEPADRRRAARRALRRLAVRRLPRRGRDVAAPQALPSCWAACSTCRTPKPMRSCCRMRAGYNAAAAPEAMTRMARALRTDDAPQGLFELAQRLALPRRLAGHRNARGRHRRAAEMAVRNPYANPRPGGARRDPGR